MQRVRSVPHTSTGTRLSAAFPVHTHPHPWNVGSDPAFRPRPAPSAQSQLLASCSSVPDSPSTPRCWARSRLPLPESRIFPPDPEPIGPYYLPSPHSRLRTGPSHCRFLAYPRAWRAPATPTPLPRLPSLPRPVPAPPPPRPARRALRQSDAHRHSALAAAAATPAPAPKHTASAPVPVTAAAACPAAREAEARGRRPRLALQPRMLHDFIFPPASLLN